ncbi:MAG: WD40 repeat domain-containing serine/threonine protein kinase, partial [Planctomycetia bacterium]|nr:WD40 repeat domain-containing serine/threonine protein kinase [Planctomycetia bacterium]
MSSTLRPSPNPDEERLLDLLDAWQQGRGSGREPTPEELCPHDSSLRELLREHIAAARALDPGTLSAVGTDNPEDSPTETDLPPAPPGYRLLRELGRGGMGVVYEAIQTRLNRPVALKMVRGGTGGTSGTRFLAEAEAVAAARHPNVVQVYESGEHNGRSFLAMEYLTGGTLSKRLKATGRMTGHAAADLVAKLARGVQAAHDRQIVHRDLKPGNVLFDETDEPKVTDFGLAKHANREDLTATGVVLGSPAYMAPEQADGKAKFVGPAADVYALGVILYECLTGTRPFTASTPAALLRQVIEAEPESLRRRAPEVARDLELICLRCLRKDSTQRYPTARALADDLANFLAGRPVSARPIRWPVRLAKWTRRNKLAASLIVTALLGAGISSALAAIAIGESGRADREAKDAKLAKERADREATDAKANAAATRKLFGQAAITEGIRRGDQGDIAAALLWFAEGLRRNPDDSTFNAENRARWAAYWNLSPRLRLASVTTIDPPTLTRGAVSLSPDGRRIISEIHNGGLRLWNASTGKPVGEPIPQKEARYHQFAPDGKHFLTIGDDETVRIWDAETATPFGIPLAPKHKIDHAILGPDGRSVLIVQETPKGPRGRMWRADTGKPIGPAVRIGAREPAISPDGTRVLGREDEKIGRVFDMISGQPVGAKLPHDDEVQGYAFSPDGKRIATADGYMVKVWDVESGKTVLPPLRFLTEVEIPVFSPDGRRLLGRTLEGPAQLWDLQSGR